MRNILVTAIAMLALISCGAKRGGNESTAANTDAPQRSEVPAFDADSAYAYLKVQVDMGPRVPNTEAHRLCGDWLAAELKRHGAEVTVMPFQATTFDGTRLNARNIFGSFNPSEADRTLLLAHYDCRPWADQDPDPAKRRQPVDGANDGASGTAVLLELARQFGAENPGKGIDILFVDAEDWGTDGDEDSWALGARHYAEGVSNGSLPVKTAAPSRAILVDMVGGKDATFPVEYFSQQAAPQLVSQVWSAAKVAGEGALFPDTYGGGVTDDHVQLINQGIPAIDIIEYHPESGFNPNWHTTTDNLDNISVSTLRSVGRTLMQYIYGQ